MKNNEQFTAHDFLQEFLESRHEKLLSDDDLKKRREEQRHMHKKFPEAEEFSYDDKDIKQGHCPYCHEDMEFDITGDLWDYETGLVDYPAIGIGRSYGSYDYYNGYDDASVDMYFKCPHCDKIFYVEV